MKILEKVDYLKLLKIALGISIFFIGYLITMFFFQIQHLKNFKQLILVYNTASINILHLDAELDRDTYFTQSFILNQNLRSKMSRIDDSYINSFAENINFLNSSDSTFIQKNNQIITLIDEYRLVKKQLFIGTKDFQLSQFNEIHNQLSAAISSYSTYIESKIITYNTNYDHLIDSSKTSGFLIALIALVIFALSYIRMNDDLDKLKRKNDEIVFMNETLNNAEMIAGFGSWKFNTVEDKFILSDNFCRLLGVEPKEFNPSLLNILSFIHPEDREEVSNLHNTSIANVESTAITYRYLLKDGTIKHMVSVGKFLINTKGQLVKVGVNQDVSELMKKTKELQEKNLKLISINSDLESFNNIVSHDLQEPLRKIQMFISRIESNEFLKNAPELTINYFKKVKSASKRMQNLMTDLVAYSMAIKGDRIFEKINLNSLFEEIREDLALVIEEKSAVITIKDLPIILGTKFQIQQLFINLISNALKYVKPGITPNISVKLENFSKDVVDEKTVSENDYYKITVSDNGIGFQQKYADKIFLLFQRLETDEIYKGTGLGLAICKKIVENNKGFISAVGVPNHGSVFSIYLPKNTNMIEINSLS